MRGIHILSNFYRCKNNNLLFNKKDLENSLKSLIIKNKLKIINKCFYKFKNAGITGIFLISESHVSIHTWPELDNSLNLDIFTCNFSENNDQKAKNLFKDLIFLFSPSKTKSKIVRR